MSGIYFFLCFRWEAFESLSIQVSPNIREVTFGDIPLNDTFNNRNSRSTNSVDALRGYGSGLDV